MGTAERLLKLYPRAWRDRYGEEFLATLEGRSLTLQQVIDVVSGAIDARLSSDVRRATGVTATGGTMTLKSLVECERAATRYSTRDAAIGAAVMIFATIAFTALGVSLRRAGWEPVGENVLNLSFFAALLLSLPFWLMKGQPWKAQAVIIGGSFALLAAMTLLARII